MEKIQNRIVTDLLNIDACSLGTLMLIGDGFKNGASYLGHADDFESAAEIVVSRDWRHKIRTRIFYRPQESADQIYLFGRYVHRNGEQIYYFTYLSAQQLVVQEWFKRLVENIAKRKKLQRLLAAFVSGNADEINKQLLAAL